MSEGKYRDLGRVPTANFGRDYPDDTLLAPVTQTRVDCPGCRTPMVSGKPEADGAAVLFCPHDGTRDRGWYVDTPGGRVPYRCQYGGVRYYAPVVIFALVPSEGQRAAWARAAEVPGSADVDPPHPRQPGERGVPVIPAETPEAAAAIAAHTPGELEAAGIVQPDAAPRPAPDLHQIPAQVFTHTRCSYCGHESDVRRVGEPCGRQVPGLGNCRGRYDPSPAPAAVVTTSDYVAPALQTAPGTGEEMTPAPADATLVGAQMTDEPPLPAAGFAVTLLPPGGTEAFVYYMRDPDALDLERYREQGAEALHHLIMPVCSVCFAVWPTPSEGGPEIGDDCPACRGEGTLADSIPAAQHARLQGGAQAAGEGGDE